MKKASRGNQIDGNNQATIGDNLNNGNNEAERSQGKEKVRCTLLAACSLLLPFDGLMCSLHQMRLSHHPQLNPRPCRKVPAKVEGEAAVYPVVPAGV